MHADTAHPCAGCCLRTNVEENADIGILLIKPNGYK